MSDFEPNYEEAVTTNRLLGAMDTITTALLGLAHVAEKGIKIDEDTTDEEMDSIFEIEFPINITSTETFSLLVPTLRDMILPNIVPNYGDLATLFGGLLMQALARDGVIIVDKKLLDDADIAVSKIRRTFESDPEQN